MGDEISCSWDFFNKRKHQCKKDECYITTLKRDTKNSPFYRQNRIVVAKERGRGVGELLFNEYRVSLGEFWRWMVVTVAQQCECT